MNILIKLMSIVSLVIAPTLHSMFSPESDSGMLHKKLEKNSVVVATPVKAVASSIESPVAKPLAAKAGEVAAAGEAPVLKTVSVKAGEIAVSKIISAAN